MYHRKAERVLYHDGILYFRSFGQSETRKLSSVQPLFCPETEISSEAWVALLPPAARRRSRSAGRAHARTHAIIHLEHHVEQQDLELEERVATIADLEQQLQVSPAPAAPTAPAEPDAESDVDEE
jgi:hypothetical protein